MPRWTGIRFYLTFPRCQTSKEVVVARAQEKWGGNLKWIVVCKELHQDGFPHLHVALCFSAKKNFVSPRWADFLADQHGDYEVMQNLRDCLKYVTKDKDFIEIGIVTATVLAKKSSTFAMVEADLRDGAPIPEIEMAHPGFVLRHLRMMEAYRSYRERTEIRTREITWGQVRALAAKDSCPELGQETASADPSNVLIADWLNGNVCVNRSFKQPQLWIWGETNLGKSSLAEWLLRHVRVYFPPLGENFYDEWEEELYDLVVFDEFKAQKKITWMNAFLQGSPFSMAVKGGQRKKLRNLPVIILSNFSPENCYWRAAPESIAPLVARLLVVHVQDFIKIVFS